jgi:ribonuclease P protein component
MLLLGDSLLKRSVSHVARMPGGGSDDDRRFDPGCPLAYRGAAERWAIVAASLRLLRCNGGSGGMLGLVPIRRPQLLAGGVHRLCDNPGASSEQAHVPAQQPSTGKDPRLPAAHAHPRGPRDHLRAAGQGPRAPDRLTAGVLVLPAGNRLRRRQDFQTAIRRGRRSGRRRLVVHLRDAVARSERVDEVVASGSAALDAVGQNGPYGSAGGIASLDGIGSVRERDDIWRIGTRSAGEAPRVGFVVSRTVGGAVGRNVVRRRLRHLMRERLHLLPPGSTIVVRALPAAAGASSAELGADLDAALRGLLDGDVA